MIKSNYSKHYKKIVVLILTKLLFDHPFLFQIQNFLIVTKMVVVVTFILGHLGVERLPDTTQSVTVMLFCVKTLKYLMFPDWASFMLEAHQTKHSFKAKKILLVFTIDWLTHSFSKSCC